VFFLLISILFLTCVPSPTSVERQSIILQARQYAPGESLVVRLLIPYSANELEGKWLGKELQFFNGKDGKVMAITGIDLEAPIGKAKLSVKTRKGVEPQVSLEKEVVIVPKEFKISRITVDDEKATPTGRNAKRVKKEIAEWNSILSKITPLRYFTRRFYVPVPFAPSSHFGVRRIVNGMKKSPHSGADLSAPIGTPVHAMAKGVVVQAKNTFLLGKTVILDHGLGIFSIYGHLSKLKVTKGRTVRPNAIIGEVGDTGRTTGPNVHWGVKISGNRVDPYSLVHFDLKLD